MINYSKKKGCNVSWLGHNCNSRKTEKSVHNSFGEKNWLQTVDMRHSQFMICIRSNLSAKFLVETPASSCIRVCGVAAKILATMMNYSSTSDLDFHFKAIYHPSFRIMESPRSMLASERWWVQSCQKPPPFISGLFRTKPVSVALRSLLGEWARRSLVRTETPAPLPSLVQSPNNCITSCALAGYDWQEALTGDDNDHLTPLLASSLFSSSSFLVAVGVGFWRSRKKFDGLVLVSAAGAAVNSEECTIVWKKIVRFREIIRSRVFELKEVESQTSGNERSEGYKHVWSLKLFD